MNDHVTDKEQVEMIKKWWNDYGKAIAVAVLIGLIIGFGWRYWHRAKIQKAERASGIYQTMVMAYVKQDKKAVAQFEGMLIKNYSGTPYASLAKFLVAREAVNANNLKQAYDNLEWVVKNSSNPGFRQIARLRSARVLIALKKPKAGLTLLRTVDDKTFAPLIDKVKADAYLALGNNKQAQAYYQKAKLGLLAVGIMDPFIEMKMAEPGVITPAT